MELLDAHALEATRKELAIPAFIQVLELNAKTRFRANVRESLAVERLSYLEQNNSSANARIVLSLILAGGTNNSKNAKIPKVFVLERNVANSLENNWQMELLNAHAREATRKELAIPAFGLELKIFAKIQNKSALEISAAKPNILLMEAISHADVLYATLQLADGTSKKKNAETRQANAQATDAANQVENFSMMALQNVFAKCFKLDNLIVTTVYGMAKV
jgi:hypothetical protein